MTDLAAGWSRVLLKDLLVPSTRGRAFQQGWSPQCLRVPASGGTWGVLKTTAVQAGNFDGQHNKQLPDSLTPRPELEVQPGDILTTCAGPRVRCGVTALVRQTQPRLMISGKMYRYRPDPSVCVPEFLELALLAPAAQRAIDAMKTGISESGLNLTHARFSSLAVDVPSTDEQRRVVDILEQHLSRLDAGVEYLRASERRLVALTSSTLNIMTQNARTRAPIARQLGDIGDWGSGGTPRAGDARFYTDGSIPWAVIGDLNDGVISSTAQTVTEAALRESSAKMVPRGSVLIAMYGSIGKLGLPNIDLATNQAIAFVSPHADVDRNYLFWWLRSQRSGLIAAGKGGAQKNVSQTILKGWSIHVPELAVQRTLVSAMDEVSRTVQQQLNGVAALEKRATLLRQALLAAAFSGRLTGRSSDLDIAEELANV